MSRISNFRDQAGVLGRIFSAKCVQELIYMSFSTFLISLPIDLSIFLFLSLSLSLSVSLSLYLSTYMPICTHSSEPQEHVPDYSAPISA